MKELKELKEINKNLSSMKSFIIAQAQLTKSLLMEIKTLRQDVNRIREILEP